MRVAPLEVERERGEGDRLGWPGTASRGIGRAERVGLCVCLLGLLLLRGGVAAGG